MTSKYWATAGLTVAFLTLILMFAFAAQSTKAATRIGPETHISAVSMADICPN